jgi:hypothetical protein
VREARSHPADDDMGIAIEVRVRREEAGNATHALEEAGERGANAR